MYRKYLIVASSLLVLALSVTAGSLYLEERFNSAKADCQNAPPIDSEKNEQQLDSQVGRSLFHQVECLRELANSVEGARAIEYAEYASIKYLTIPFSKSLALLILFSIVARLIWVRFLSTRSSNVS
jgi:hypothetical protein